MTCILKKLTPASSAASEENKNTWLSKGLVRRLLRTSSDMIDRDLEEVVNQYDRKASLQWV